jgi:serine/threonine protein kinase
MERAVLNRRLPADSNEYKLYEEIGEGVSATVYRALCVPLDVVVAIKVLDLEKCSNDLVSYVPYQVYFFTFLAKNHPIWVLNEVSLSKLFLV